MLLFLGIYSLLLYVITRLDKMFLVLFIVIRKYVCTM